MENRIPTLMKYISKAQDALVRWKNSTVFLIFHDDADGVTSASILKALLTELNFDIHEVCLEKAYPYALEIIHREAAGGIVIYADIGSPHAKLIQKLNKDSLVIILDHHDAPRFFAENIYNINPEFFGFSGEREVSGSTISYIFAKHVKDDMKKYSKLALIGSYEIPGPIRGLNEIPLSDALKANLAKIRGESVLIETPRGYLGRSTLSRILTILSSVGYYNNGPKVAVEGCLADFPDEVFDRAKTFEKMRSVANKKLLKIIQREGLELTEYVQWFKDRGVFKGMGTKVIGTFCSYLTYRSRIVDQMKYLVGFMNVLPEIPGLGKLSGELVKFSIRVPKRLQKTIDRGEYPPASNIAVDAASRLDGFADGHAYAASGVIPENKENMLIKEMNKLIADWKRGSGKSGRKSSITDFL